MMAGGDGARIRIAVSVHSLCVWVCEPDRQYLYAHSTHSENLAVLAHKMSQHVRTQTSVRASSPRARGFTNVCARRWVGTKIRGGNPFTRGKCVARRRRMADTVARLRKITVSVLGAGTRCRSRWRREKCHVAADEKRVHKFCRATIAAGGGDAENCGCCGTVVNFAGG